MYEKLLIIIFVVNKELWKRELSKMLGKKLDANFKEVSKWQYARYLIHEDGEVELLWDAVSVYMTLSAEDIFKLAEIVKEMVK